MDPILRQLGLYQPRVICHVSTALVHKSDSWSGRALPSPGEGKVVEGGGLVLRGEVTGGQVLWGTEGGQGKRAPNKKI